jgi:hypothetical protein
LVKRPVPMYHTTPYLLTAENMLTKSSHQGSSQVVPMARSISGCIPVGLYGTIFTSILSDVAGWLVIYGKGT